MAKPLLSRWVEYLRFRDAFAALLDPALYPIEWLDGEIKHGNILLLSADDSAILVSVKTYPSGLQEIHGEAAIGKRADIVSILIPQAENFGRSIGCKFGSISSRPGWERVMREHGYDLHQTTLRKSL